MTCSFSSATLAATISFLTCEKPGESILASEWGCRGIGGKI
jgi:hypothetical protein